MLIESTTFNGLDVCPDCGWTVIQIDKRDHPAECRKVEGANANKLANSMPSISSTKLGYGGGNLTFNFDDRTSITMRALSNGEFSIESFYAIDHLDANAARDLVTVIDAWRKRRR